MTGLGTITVDGERKAWFGEGTVDPQGKSVVIEPEDPPAPMDAERVTGRILTWQPPENGHAVFDRAEAFPRNETPPAWSDRYAEVAPNYPSWR